ncbi:SpoIIE family protein phosphatase [Spirosoma sp. KCTC 42546]|uniref:ATP-binding SpoIIE family protein phosphatase n=1 Tax=Spirosoma sp. KCTC 42546 TaxID=2520506 RepID=UPI00115763A7|nr:ATP-binding SpoIIE family protein phosphatase [Spirosoma sp. KCTC 42546]QDK82091.1 SpoIIE family protein phosphatase [Spirosoma sp. KCTC 42546]
MDNSAYVRFQAPDRSYLALLKKGINQIAIQAGFQHQRLSEIDLIVAEMASNLIKHGGGGDLFVQHFQSTTQSGIELISIDNGPGMADATKMVRDGVSTTSTLGHGLGSINRLADQVQIYSMKGWGTILLARIFLNPTNAPIPERASGFDFRSLLVAKPGETLCGDGCYLKMTPSHIKLFLGDGLGHGPEAYAAVQTAITAFRHCPDHRPVDIIRYMHRSVTKTRGLVGSVVVYDVASQRWNWCGVGNISTRLSGAMASKNFLSYNGIIGMNLPATMNDHTLPFERGQLLIMCSDGLQSRWDHTRYPFIHRYDLTILAAALYKDYSRQTDDTSVFVGRAHGDHGGIS